MILLVFKNMQDLKSGIDNEFNNLKIQIMNIAGKSKVNNFDTKSHFFYVKDYLLGAFVDSCFAD